MATELQCTTVKINGTDACGLISLEDLSVTSDNVAKVEAKGIIPLEDVSLKAANVERYAKTIMLR